MAEELKPPGSITKKGGEAWFIEISRTYEKRRDALKDLASSFTSNASGDDTMPSAEFRSYRTAAENMRKAITQRSGSSRSPGRDGAPHAASFDGADEEEEGMSDEELMSTMQAQWVEVECLLRVQLRSPDALDEARRHVRASLTFDESLAATAESSKQLKGTIFQALLAFADGRAESTAASVNCEIGEAEWQELSRGSDALRKLVRIKVQDDNDLKAANQALQSCAEFFENLKVYATRHSLEETAVLPKLEAF